MDSLHPDSQANSELRVFKETLALLGRHRRGEGDSGEWKGEGNTAMEVRAPMHGGGAWEGGAVHATDAHPAKLK